MYNAKVYFKNDCEQNLNLTVRTEKGGTLLGYSDKLDYSEVKYIEFDFDCMNSVAGEDGYILLSRHPLGGKPMEDFGLCYYKNRENTEYVSGFLVCPVIGMKKGDKAIVCIATGMAADSRQVVRVNNDSYSMSMRFSINEIYDGASIGEIPYEDINVLVYELEGENADYSGMARIYRDYQLKYGGFKRITDRLTPELDYASKSLYIRVRHGWKPVPTQIADQTIENEPPMHTACTFKQVEKLMQEYYDSGIRNAEFCLVGWNIKGHDGRWPQIFPVEEDLGGEKDLLELIAKAKELGFGISCHTNFTESFAIAENFDIENMLVSKDGTRPSIQIWAGGRSYTTCPKMALENAKEQLPKVALLGFDGLLYVDVITSVNPPDCYHPNHKINKKESINYYKKLFSLSKELFGGIASEGSSDFCLSECDFCLYISFARDPEKMWELFDVEIPFWQIVYHGICLYNSYTRTVNSAISADRSNLLKSFECGDRPAIYYYSKFRGDGRNWMGDIDFRCGTDDEIRDGIKAVKHQYDIFKELTYLQTVFIERHKEISQNVFEIKYEDGSVVIANYNSLTLTLKNANGQFEFKI